MKGFTDTTKTIAGHNFPRSSVAVGAHQRAMPVKTPQMPMPQGPQGVPPQGASPLAVSAPAAPSATGLSPTGYPPRPARLTLKETGKLGVRKPRMSQIEPSNGAENGFAKGGRITAAKRKGMLKSEFGLPGERKYPMPDRSHAANAKARATQQVAKGNLSESSKAKIDAKANRVLGKARGGPVRDPRSPMIKPKW